MRNIYTYLGSQGCLSSTYSPCILKNQIVSNLLKYMYKLIIFMTRVIMYIFIINLFRDTILIINFVRIL
jgi:hypothetical protein